jgi:hypothetical protein
MEKYLDGLLKNNFLYKEPILMTKQLSKPIYDLKFDRKNIIVSSYDQKVMCFNTNTKVKVKSESEK